MGIYCDKHTELKYVIRQIISSFLFIVGYNIVCIRAHNCQSPRGPQSDLIKNIFFYATGFFKWQVYAAKNL